MWAVNLGKLTQCRLRFAECKCHRPEKSEGSLASFGQPTHWEGVSFTGLTAGDYQFTYIPIVNPSLEWSIYNPNMNGIFTITGAVINGETPLPAALPLFSSLQKAHHNIIIFLIENAIQRQNFEEDSDTYLF